MIKIYYAFTDVLRKNNPAHLMSKLSSRARSKMDGFKRIEDKHLLLTSLYLLSKVLIENGYENYELNDLQYDLFGRPFFADSPFDFNLSHSGDIAAVVFSENCRVGIDIEKVADVDFSDFKTVFSPMIWNKIDSSDRKSLTFFNYWTLLESALKADGRGLSITSSDISVILEEQIMIDGKKWFSCHQNIDPSVACCVTFDKKDEEIELSQIV